MPNEEQKNMITRSFMNTELVPEEVASQISLKDATSISYDDLKILGGMFAMVATSIIGSAKGLFGDKLYRVVDKFGNTIKYPLNKFNDGSGLLCSYFDNDGKPHQGRLVQPNLNFTTNTIIQVAVAIVIKGFMEKLDTIQETQEDILSFLQDDKRASLKANIDFLTDILTNYKHNWDNEMYKTNMHIKVLDIRQSAEQNIEFYRTQIARHIEKKGFFTSDGNTKKRLSKVRSDLEDYRTSLNLFAFSSYVEVLLLENYSSEYLDCVSAKIRDNTIMHRETYSECYERFKDYFESSINSAVIKGVAAVSKFTGNTIAKIPLIRNGQLDEKLVESHSTINKWNDDRPEEILRHLTACKDVSTNTFADNIDSINRLYNNPTVVYFDSKRIYFMSASA